MLEDGIVSTVLGLHAFLTSCCLAAKAGGRVGVNAKTGDDRIEDGCAWLLVVGEGVDIGVAGAGVCNTNSGAVLGK